MKRTIAVVVGYWSTNIGNSFFQLGAYYLLNHLFPNDRVVIIQDQPGYWNVRQGNPANAFLPVEHMELDYLVILGPFLRPEYERIWRQTIRKVRERGTRIMVLAAGMMDYRPSSIEHYRRWLSEMEPFVFTTRDEETYHHCGDLANHAYNGIDVAFFLPEILEPVGFDMDKFVVFNFDKDPEPSVWLTDQVAEPSSPDHQAFSFHGQTWNVRFPSLRTTLSRKLKAYTFLDAFVPGSYPEMVGDYLIVRTDHRFNPMIMRKSYRAPNSFVADIPHTYCHLYAKAALTLSNRVHACVAALAYGNYAMLFSDTPRMGLLHRVGIDGITDCPQCLDKDYLAQEKANLTHFLKDII